MTSVLVRDVEQFAEIAELLERRKRLGLDRRDEVWEGVLHMSPAPHHRHGLMAAELARVLGNQALLHDLGRVIAECNVREVRSGEENYRIPDLLLATREQLARSFRDGWAEGPLALVVEVHSPSEDPREKLPFYARRGVAEVLVVDWETLEPMVFLLANGEYTARLPDGEGFLSLEGARLRLRRGKTGESSSLEVVDAVTGERIPFRA